ncbi:hypothetical protein MSAN_02359200 [Mycena sanguinolenta]|uniref:Uncharacterized protein n=1 Tax=Mycena sanguinolenta TaxID=230812 RepID=A0A8H6X5K0_9AGAR|nr:hypothetical protein MSAN_02359200 [Mycena sanguinolenta]
MRSIFRAFLHPPPSRVLDHLRHTQTLCPFSPTSAPCSLGRKLLRLMSSPMLGVSHWSKRYRLGLSFSVPAQETTGNGNNLSPLPTSAKADVRLVPSGVRIPGPMNWSLVLSVCLIDAIAFVEANQVLPVGDETPQQPPQVRGGFTRCRAMRGGP